MRSLLLALLTVSACTDGENADGVREDGPPLTAGVPGLVGDWLENGCVGANGQSFKRLVRAEARGASGISYAQGVVSYVGEDCAGTGTRVGPSPMGEIEFVRSESNSRVAASWGDLTTVTGSRSAVIWAKKTDTVLCLLGDESPTNQPTLTAVESSLATVAEQGCFLRQPDGP
jgi:hypothetical protein